MGQGTTIAHACGVASAAALPGANRDIETTCHEHSIASACLAREQQMECLQHQFHSQCREKAPCVTMHMASLQSSQCW